MKISRLQAFICALTLSVFAAPASAASVSLVAPAGVQTAPFQVTVLGDFPTGLASGAIDLSWDDTLLQLDLFTFNLVIDPTLSCPSGLPPTAGCPADTSSTARIAWGNFFAPPIAFGTAPGVLMATLDFTPVGTGTDVIINVDAGLGWLDATFSPIATPDLFGTSVDVNAIPVPAAVWLFGSGLLGLIGVARRRKAA